MKTALFAGSFDPFTIGHKDIADRGLRIFDRLVIGVGVSEHKKGEWPVERRIAAINEIYGGDMRVVVEAYSGLTVDFARHCGAEFLLRGVRSVSDFEAERQLADVNRHIAGIDTVILFSRPDLSFVSSSMVRELRHNGYDISRYLPYNESDINNKK